MTRHPLTYLFIINVVLEDLIFTSVLVGRQLLEEIGPFYNDKRRMSPPLVPSLPVPLSHPLTPYLSNSLYGLY